MGVSETVMWGLLRNRCREYKFRRQHPVGPYFMDFTAAKPRLPSSLTESSMPIKWNTMREGTPGWNLAESG